MLALLAGFNFAVHAHTAATGLLIYSEPPSTYIDSTEYVSISSNLGYSTIGQPDGTSIQIRNGGTQVIVAYPPATPGADFEPEANQNIQKIQKLIKQYPKLQKPLVAAQTKWQNALAFVKQLAIRQQNNQSSAKSDKLTFTTTDGRLYKEVEITKADESGISITSPDGIEHLKFSVLPKEIQERYNYDPASAEHPASSNPPANTEPTAANDPGNDSTAAGKFFAWMNSKDQQGNLVIYLGLAFVGFVIFLFIRSRRSARLAKEAKR